MRKTDKIVKDIFGETMFVHPVRGSQLKKWREALGVSRKDFAKLCGRSETFLRGIERGGTGVRYVSSFMRDRIVAAIIAVCRKKVEKQGANPS